MIHLVKKKKVPFKSEDIFDLVNDTESYSEFLPFCKKSRVMSQDGCEKFCELTFSKGPIARSLITRNILTPKEKIEVFLHKGDFKHLHGLWLFESVGTDCLVTVEFEYEFSSSFIESIFGPVFNMMTERMVDIFMDRANDVLR